MRVKSPAILFVLMLLVPIASCRQERDANILPESKFVSVYGRLTTASVTARPPLPDSLARKEFVDSVLALEGVTRDQFETTIRWYNEDVQRWRSFFDEVVRALEDSVRTQKPLGKNG
jgi:hypothetical protein